MMWVTPEGARPAEELNVEELPAGAIHRRYIKLAEDGVGLSIRVPVLIAKGNKPGPVVGIVAALHGNELNGIPLIHRLFRDLAPDKVRGTVVAVIVANVPGLLLHQRVFNDGEDLNRIFPGRPDGNCSQVYAYNLLHRIVKRFDRLIDLHTASFGRVNSLYIRANMDDPEMAKMARLVQPQIILNSPAPIQTLRGQAIEAGIPAITVEIGNPSRIQRDMVRTSLLGIKNLLRSWKVLPGAITKHKVPTVYCKDSAWMYTDCGGFLETLPTVATIVEKGQVLARMRNIFGDIIREYHAPHDGVIIGRSVNPVSQTGARIVHLGEIGSEE
jgi:predicted deacylase